MSAAESLGEKRNSFVFPLTKISRRLICNTDKNKIGTLELYMKNITRHIERNITRTTVPYVTLNTVTSGSKQVQVK